MLVMTMCPTADFNVIHISMPDLLAHAQKLEEDIFEVANTDSEYRRMIIDMVKNVSETDFSAETD